MLAEVSAMFTRIHKREIPKGEAIVTLTSMHPIKMASYGDVLNLSPTHTLNVELLHGDPKYGRCWGMKNLKP